VPLYLGRWDLSRVPRSKSKGTRRVKRTSSPPKIVVTSDGRGVVGHAGARLLVDLASPVPERLKRTAGAEHGGTDFVRERGALAASCVVDVGR
jgi:hypothetical protein